MIAPGRLVVASLALVATGCSGFLGGSGEVAELEKRVLELQRQAAVHEVELDRLRRRLAALEPGGAAAPKGTVGQAAPSATESIPAASPGSRPSQPVAAAEPEIEEGDLDPFVEPAIEPQAEPARSLPVDEPIRELLPVPREAQRVYDEAYTLYHQGQHAEAERVFQTFLAANPATELSDNAQYWVGASRFARGDYRGALAAFRETVERYPTANKVPDALFKIGQCLEELGEPGEALAVYDELESRFPNTAAATLAAERRAQLQGDPTDR